MKKKEILKVNYGGRHLEVDATMIRSMIDALTFYADIDTYFATVVLVDKPCGALEKDFSKMPCAYSMTGKKSVPGKKARIVLKKLLKKYIHE